MSAPQNVFPGDRFGRLVVVAQEGRRNGYRTYRCVCDCGTEAVVKSRDLNAGDTRSCGCLRRESAVRASQVRSARVRARKAVA
jgi:hypothetical protein